MNRVIISPAINLEKREANSGFVRLALWLPFEVAAGLTLKIIQFFINKHPTEMDSHYLQHNKLGKKTGRLGKG